MSFQSNSKSTNKMMTNKKQFNLISAFLLLIALYSCLLISETMAGKNKGGDDIM